MVSEPDIRALRLHDCACLNEAGGFEAAAAAMWRRSLAINRKNARALISLGLLLWKWGGTEEAISLVRESLLCEEISWSHTLLARDHTVAGRLGEALTEFQLALKLDQSPELLFDVAAAHLRLGDFATGLPLHSASNRAYSSAFCTHPSVRWKGEPVDKLLVLSRLGYGDEVMFARFIKEAKTLGVGKIVVWAKPDSVPFYGELQQSGLIEIVISADPTDYPYQIENFALPEIVGCGPDSIPRGSEPRSRAARGSTLRVGVVWSGSDKTATNPIRQVPFEALLPLADNPDIHLYSFQTGSKSVDIAKAHAQMLVRDMSASIEWDWALTARALDEIDVLVCPDCGIAHWAASRGVPVFLMLSAYCDWRWSTARSDSAWYPSMRLFRQSRVGDWRSVVAKIKAALGEERRRNEGVC